MRIATGQLATIPMTIPGFQLPAFIQQCNPGNKPASIPIAIAISQLDQRESDSRNESRFDPSGDTGNNNGGGGQKMANAAAKQQKPRRTQLKGNLNRRQPLGSAKEALA